MTEDEIDRIIKAETAEFQKWWDDRIMQDLNAILAVPFDVKPGTLVAIGHGIQADTAWSKTGEVVANNQIVGMDGIHRVEVRFCPGKGEWTWPVDITLLVLR